MSCTKEEIERKRLAALQKRQSKISPQNASLNNSPIKFGSYSTAETPGPSNHGPVKTFPNNNSKTYHPYAKPMSGINQGESSVPVGKVVTGTVYLISEDRFEVKPSEFCPPLINVFKSILSKSYGKSELIAIITLGFLTS